MFRILTVTSNAVLELRGFTLVSGSSTDGGAIWIDGGGAARLVRCVMADNKASGTSGLPGKDGEDSFGTGEDGTRGGNGTDGRGGAIFNNGILAIDACRFLTNAATGGSGGAGGAGGDGRLQGGDGAPGGNGANGWGGAIFNSGQLSITNTMFEGNMVAGGAGGAGGSAGQGPFVARSGVGGGGAGGFGAAVCSLGDASLHASTFSTNRASGGASAAGGTYHDGNGTDGFLGGPSAGGGVWSMAGLTIVNCTFSDNSATGGAGGDGGPAQWTAGKGGDGGSASGGAIWSSGDTAVTNCTFALNAAIGGTNGVAGQAPFPNSNGRVGLSVGGGIAQSGGFFLLKNSVLKHGVSGGNGSGMVTDAGHNISSDASFPLGSSSLAVTDPKLGALADNGGPTATIVPMPGSPAIQGADSAMAPAVDQRGQPRPASGKFAADIGAVEFVPARIICGPTNLVVINGQSVTFSVEAGGDSPLHFSWRLNSAPITCATNSTYFIAQAAAPHEGYYSVMISNACGSATSPAARLTVLGLSDTRISNLKLIDNQPVVTIPSRAGCTYITEFKSNLKAPRWIPVSTNAGTGATLAVPLPNPASTSAFYRVRIY